MTLVKAVVQLLLATSSSGAAKVVVARVADDESNVMASSEPHSLGDMLSASGINCIADVIAQRARGFRRLERVAALIGKYGSHYR